VKQASKVLASLVAMPALVFALVRAYDVPPTTAQLSGWTRFQDSVGQVLTVNFDLPITASLFCGSRGGNGTYNVGIYSYPGGVTELAYKHNAQVPRDHSWLNCSLTVAFPDSFVKGRQVEVRWTRSGQDSIQYYYQDEDPYPYGLLVANLPDPVPLDWDLACRVMGVMLPVDSTYWGFNMSPIVWVLGGLRNTVKQRAAAAGMGMVRDGLPWSWIQPRSPDTFDFTNVDVCVDFVHDTLGCEMVGMLLPCAKWASTRITWDSTNERLDTCELCPPRNLWPLPESVNYWARYVDAVVRRYCDRVKTYEVWNEPHLLNVFWQYPNIPESLGGYAVSDTQGMCSLYVRLCFVAD
jgi:hypothetical protein